MALDLACGTKANSEGVIGTAGHDRRTRCSCSPCCRERFEREHEVARAVGVGSTLPVDRAQEVEFALIGGGEGHVSPGKQRRLFLARWRSLISELAAA